MVNKGIVAGGVAAVGLGVTLAGAFLGKAEADPGDGSCEITQEFLQRVISAENRMRSMEVRIAALEAQLGSARGYVYQTREEMRRRDPVGLTNYW